MGIHPAARSTRLIVGTIGLALLLVGVAGVVLLRTTGLGAGGLGGASNRLEDWIGGQLVGVANSYLVPQLDYAEIDYRAPGTVSLEDVTFTAPDGTRVLEVGGMVVTLAEVPRIGHPIVIERLTLERPNVRLIREQGSDGAAGFKGLSPIVKNAPTRDEDVQEEFRLSNVLRLRRIDIEDGSFHYDEGDGSPPMTLSGLTTRIDAAPDEEEAGWYAIDLVTEVGPLAELTASGLLSLDTFVARFESARFHGELSPESAGALPPQLQELVTRYEARGQIDLSGSGVLALADPATGEFRLNLALRGLRLASGEYHLPVESVDAEANLASGIATLASLRAELLGGSIEARGDAQLAETGMPATLSWTIDNVELRELLRAGGEGERPKLAGKLTGSGEARTALGALRESLGGSGELHVREGTLAALPVLQELARVMSIATLDLLRGAFDHSADAEFDLVPAGLSLTALEITTEALVARGKGMVNFDGSFDLRLNAGPMEKVQSLLGRAGDVLGAITDRLVKYRIRGTFADPKVSVDPLGIGG